MSLPACQQRVLDGMAGTLQARDPQLASLFSIFTRLNGQEPMPRAEELTVSTGRLRRVASALGRVFAGVTRLLFVWAARLRLTRVARLRPMVIVPVALAALASLLIMAPLTGSRRACGSAHPAAAAATLSRSGVCQFPRPAGYAGR
jgi:hypothetical protein